MTISVQLRALLLGLFAFAITACDSADSGPGAEIALAVEQRQGLFEDVGDAFKAIRGELEGGAPNLALIGEQAGVINARALSIEGLWPVGSDVESGVDTEALPSIWQKPDEFAQATQKLIEASASMVEIAASGDLAEVQAAVRPVGMACKGCHDNFRLDTD